MEQIAGLRNDPNSPKSKKISPPENWIIKGGDTITVKLIPREVITS